MTEAFEAGSGDGPEKIGGITVVPRPTRNRLGELELVDYRDHRRKLIQWVLNIGKDPERGEGYAYYTARGRLSRLDQFYRWVWDQEGGYTTEITHGHADGYMKELAYGDTSQDNKASHMKCLKMLFRWRALEFGDEKWDPEITFTNDTSTTNPRDYLTLEERRKVREAALKYGSIPSYPNLTPDERDRWKQYLAMRFEKPKSEVTPRDFERANSWKYVSMIWTALDTGLRPVEVERASTRWVDVDNRVLRIPKEDSSKNEDNWIVSITDRTTSVLSRWLTERCQYEKYDDMDSLWLTRDGNPYQSSSLNYVLRQVCDVAGISTENRSVSWYSIRHSVGTFMAREGGLGAAQAQLRHQSEQTTLRYDQAPVEDRRDALNRMG